MNYCQNPEADEPIMLLDKHIGEDPTEGMGINSSLFCTELMQLDEMGKKLIKVYINSPGGDMAGGMQIYHAMLNTKTKVDTYNAFMACSVSAVIFEAGRNRVMADYALLMFHSPYYPDGSKADEALSSFRDSYATATAQRAGKTRAEIDKMLDKDTWINAQEALAEGFCDEIQESADYNKKRITVKNTPAERSNPKALWTKGNKILSSIFKPSTDMKKIAALLNMDDDAGENAIASMVKKVMAKAEDMEAKFGEKAKALTDCEAKLKAATDELAKAKADYDDMDAKMKASKKEMDDKEMSSKKEKASAFVKIHVAAGRIKNDPKIIAAYEKDATEDFDGTKEKVEAIGVTKAATSITKVEGDVLPGAGSAQARMIQIAARSKQKIG